MGKISVGIRVSDSENWKQKQKILDDLSRLILLIKNFRISEIRQTFGLTQDKLAYIAGLPVRTICRWEQSEGKTLVQPRIETLRKIRDGLKKLL